MSRQIKDDIDCVPHLHAIYLWVILHFRTLPPINLGIFKIQEVERNPFSTNTFDLFLPRFFRVPVNEPSLPAWLGKRSLGHETDQNVITRKCDVPQITSSSAHLAHLGCWPRLRFCGQEPGGRAWTAGCHGETD